MRFAICALRSALNESKIPLMISRGIRNSCLGIAVQHGGDIAPDLLDQEVCDTGDGRQHDGLVVKNDDLCV